MVMLVRCDCGEENRVICNIFPNPINLGDQHFDFLFNVLFCNFQNLVRVLKIVNVRSS